VRFPLGWLLPQSRGQVLWWSGTVVVVLFAVLMVVDRRLKQSGAGIVRFEFAGTPERAELILRRWGPEGRKIARLSLLIDGLWLVSYAMFLAVASLGASESMRVRGWDRLAAAGVLVAWMQLAAGALDAVEDIALLAVLSGHTGQPYPGLARVSAVGKFALALGLGVPYVLLGVIATVRRHGLA
jgi:hypothetical protein